MHLAHYLGLLHRSEEELREAMLEVGQAHKDEVDVFHTCQRLAEECARHAQKLGPFANRYGENAPTEPERLQRELFDGTRKGGLELLRELQDLYLMVCECDMAWTVIGQGAQGARDEELIGVVDECKSETATQLLWLKTRMKQAAPQALVVAE